MKCGFGGEIAMLSHERLQFIMKYRFHIVVIVCILIVGALALLYQKGNAVKTNFEESEKSAAARNAGEIYVQSFLVKKVAFSDTLRGLAGTVRGASLELKSSQEECLSKYNYRPGDYLKRGDVIVELDHTRSKARLKQVQIELERKKKLFEVGGASKSEVEQAEESYNIAKKDYEDTFITAPKKGYLGEILAQEGEIVTRQSPIAYFVSAEDPYFIETTVIEKKIPSISSGQKVEIFIDMFPGETIMGEVLGISPEVLMTSRMVPMRIGLPETYNKRFRPGLSATCNVIVFSGQTLVVPVTSLSEGKDRVFVVASDNQAHARDIATGYKSRDYVEVLSGLNEGDVIINSPDYAGVNEGARVKYSQPEEYKAEQK
ncbi:MAG: efflux RND transporter periplasmic adaptor subunit [Elusimicrobiota bacterium]